MANEMTKASDIKTLIKGAIIGGLIFFVWTNVSWMAIGWHNSYMSAVPNEEVFAESIREEIPKSGLYFVPWHDQSSDWDEVMKKTEKGPFAYMMITPHGKSMSMALPLLMSLIFNCFLAMLGTWLLLQTSGLSFLGRVGFVVVVGLSGSSWLVFANWNWWGFPTTYLIVNLVDLGIAWTLMGFGLARFVVRN
jgi:hypothetical protein